MRNGCLKININDESALEVDENSTRDRLGRDDYYKSHYLVGPVARIQGLLIVCQTIEKDQEVLNMLKLAIGEAIDLRARINQYFEEEEKKKEKNEGDDEKSEGGNG